MSAGVYQILNTVSGSCYVGSAVNIKSRWAAHRHTLRSKGKAPPKLQRAWDKYGEAAFEFRVLVQCSKENTLFYEQLAINALKPKYNTRQTAHSNLGVKWSAETNAKKARCGPTYTVQGVTGHITALARHFGAVSPTVASHRIKRGMSVEDAVTRPPMSKRDIGAKAAQTHKRNGTHPSSKQHTINGVTGSIKDLIGRFAVAPERAVRTRMQRGWSLEKALFTPPIASEDRDFTKAPKGVEQWKAAKVEIDGVVDTYTGHAARYGQVTGVAMARRVRKGWTPEDAAKTPARFPNPAANKKSSPRAVIYEVAGVRGPLRELAKRFGISHATVSWRISKGWPVEEAFTTPARPKQG